jgi:arylsulfatase A-like enzyme
MSLSRKSIRGAAVSGSLLGVAAMLIAPSASARNIIIFALDDAAVDKVSAYAGDFPGYAAAQEYLPQTDTIDSLAGAGLRFTRAWSNPLCSPTRASLYTGIYPFRHGLGFPLNAGADGLDPTLFPMLAQVLKDMGSYETGIFGKWHIGEEDAAGNPGPPATSPFFDAPHPVLTGFDRYFGKMDGYIGSFENWDRIGWLGNAAIGHTGVEATHATQRTAEVALNWINTRTGDFFAVIAFHAPHEASNGWHYGDARPDRIRSAGLACLDPADPSHPCVNEEMAVYQGLVEDVDIAIEDVLTNMDAAKRADTTVMVIGDNGTPSEVQEDVFADGRGKGTAYENGIRVPLIIADAETWFSGAGGAITAPGRTVNAGVHVMDIFQTVVNEALMVSLGGVDSISMIDCYTDTGTFCGRSGQRYGYAETFRLNGPGTAINSAEIAIHYGYDTMVATYDPVGGCMDQEYYDTSADPLQTNALAWAALPRGQRLCTHFATLHNSEPGSWAFQTPAGTLVPFCTAC